MQSDFLKPKLIGKRFNGHAVPLELLKDFAALQEMLVEVAKWKYLQEHQERVRVQRNFSKDIELQLSAIEDGSAVLNIVLAVSSVTSSLFPPVNPLPKNAQYFEQAKTAIVESIAQSAEGRSPELPPRFLSYFDRFGRSLRAGESIEFPRPQGPVTLDSDLRKKLILAAKVETWTEETALRVKIHEVDQAHNSFGFELSDGSKANAPIDDKYRDTIVDALKAYPSGTFFQIQGVVQRDHFDRVKGFESIEDITPLDPLDTTLRLEQIAQLEDGWLDGGGHAPAKDKLEWLKQAFEEQYGSELPLPYLYPTEEGGIQAEWRSGDWSITLDVNLETRRGEYQALNLKSGDVRDEQFSLADAEGWLQLNQALQEIYNAEAEASKRDA